MTCRPDRRLLAAILLAFALPAIAAPAEDPLADARKAIEAGDGIAAEVAARRAMDAGAARAAVAAYMGEAFALQGKEGDALYWLEPGEFDRASAERGFRALGRLNAARDRFGAAFDAYERALAANPRSAGVWVDIARLRYRAGEQHVVRNAVARALQIDPKDPAALAMQAQLVRDSEGLLAALPWFERAIEVAPKDVDLLGDYAATLGEAGRYSAMLAVVRTMTKLEPGYSRSYYLQAVLAARAGQNDLARRLLWRASDEVGDTPAGLVLEGILDFRSGRAALAVEKFDEVVRRQPDNERATILLARALMASDSAGEAIDYLLPLADRATASPYVLTLLGRAYEQRGMRAEAAHWLDRAGRPSEEGVEAMPLDQHDELEMYRWANDPDQPGVVVARLRYLVAGRQFTEASAFAAQVNERYKGSVDIETLIGDSALLAGQPGPAMAAYQSAARVRMNSELVERIIWTMKAAQRSDAARDLLIRAHRQSPQNSTLAALAGRQVAEDGNWPQAISLLEQTVALGRERDARLFGELARLKLRAGDTKGALASARRAYALQRWNPQIAGALADALEASGAKGADMLLAKARQSSPPTALAMN
ncbi:tetratricopeptide repeat protein [Tsuneonella sp. HG222]